MADLFLYAFVPKLYHSVTREILKHYYVGIRDVKVRQWFTTVHEVDDLYRLA